MPSEARAGCANEDHTTAEDFNAITHLLVGFAELVERNHLTQTWVDRSRVEHCVVADEPNLSPATVSEPPVRRQISTTQLIFCQCGLILMASRGRSGG
jgi:hypothetical protein